LWPLAGGPVRPCFDGSRARTGRPNRTRPRPRRRLAFTGLLASQPPRQVDFCVRRQAGRSTLIRERHRPGKVGTIMDDDLTRTAEPAGAQPGPPADGRAAAPPGYELLAEVGRGGMGVVYRARETAFNRDVAVKFLRERHPADSPELRRF